MTRRHFLILLVLAFLARLPLLWTPFWYDENYTLILARLPFAQMLQATAGDVHPPLWYFLEWLIFRLPLSPIFLRLPALLISLAALVLFRAVLKNFSLSERVQSAALVIMAFAPMQVYYASEGRMYSFLCFLVLAGVLAAQKRQWGWLCLISTALAYTHNFGLFYAVGLWLFTISIYPFDAFYKHELPSRWFIVTAPFIVSFVAWLPWANVLLHQMESIRQSYWIVRVDAGLVLYQIYQQIWGMALPHPASIVVTFSALLLGVWTLRRRLDILALAFAPLLMAVVVSLLWQPVLLYRAVIGTSPFLYILLASLMVHITTRRRALLALIFVAPMVLMATVNLYYGGLTNSYRDGALDYLKVIAANYQSGDIIAATSDTFVVNSMPYADFTLPVVMIEECKPALGALTNQTRTAMGYHIRTWDELHGRIWLVGGTSPLVYQCEADFYQTVTAGLTPVLDMPSADGLIHTSMWLIEK